MAAIAEALHQNPMPWHSRSHDGFFHRKAEVTAHTHTHTHTHTHALTLAHTDSQKPHAQRKRHVDFKMFSAQLLSMLGCYKVAEEQMLS